MMHFEVRITCACGHTHSVECVLADHGQAPILCPACKLSLLFKHIDTPRIKITIDPRKPEEEMIDVEVTVEDDGYPKVH